MPFLRPTLQQIIDRMVSDLNTWVANANTFLRRSVFLIFSRVFGMAVHLIYGFLDYMKKQLFVSQADSEYLDVHGTEYGIPRKIGTKATGSCVVTGTNGIVIPAETKLAADDGSIYITTSDATIAGGSADIDFIAEDYGDEYNESAGIGLSFVSPISGVSSVATVGSGGITGGVDAETDEDYRSRLLLRKRQPPHGGAEFDYESWGLEVSGVTRAWTIPFYNGPGTVGLAFVKDNETDIIPTSTDRLTMYNYIISHLDPDTNTIIGIPVTAQAGFIVIPIMAKTINMTIELYPNTSVIRASVIDRMQDLFKTRGGPGEIVSLSQMYEAISSAVGEVRSKITYPYDDVSAAVNEVHVLGDITFEDYA